MCKIGMTSDKANLEASTFPAMQERGNATTFLLKPRAMDYKADDSFHKSFNFLNVRWTPNIGSEGNALFKFPRSDFAGCALKEHQTLGLDQSPCFHVDEVLFPSGARMESDWVARGSEHQQMPALAPKPQYFFELLS